MNKNVRNNIENCTYCPKLCRSRCPVSETTGSESVTPRQKVLLAGLAITERVHLTHDVVQNSFDCVQCYACQPLCLLGNDVPQTLNGAKQYYWQNKYKNNDIEILNNELHKSYVQFIGRNDISFSQRAHDQIVFFPGRNTPLISELYKRQFELIMKVNGGKVGLSHWALQHSVPFLQFSGMTSLLQATVLEFEKSYGHLQFAITNDPTLVWVMNETIRKFTPHASVRWIHYIEFLKSTLHTLHINENYQAPLVFHEPCYSARKSDYTSWLNAFLSTVCDENLIKPIWHGEHTSCCGGSCYKEVREKNALHITQRRLEEFKHLGVAAIVTICPFCIENFRSAGSIHVYDFAELFF